ncbi:hypothetical protein BJF79_08355 [Actinomadura sp. CNU-125]|uniref:CU044_5270 family protein n=1 Tax=Actinomadura sp. CNU-125 TaxID=1904961 RepID=UPI00096493D2|nr:CU044_5270 family protein [Actinomadura sp. CNU-125]OLT32564.1 hypothetical protein BJF79_08355 [Actinomadura sp. CNU-125]
MDEIDVLRGMRTALAEEEHPEVLAGRVDWRNAPSAPVARRSLSRPRLAIPLVGVVAAGAAAAVALVPGDGAGGEVRAEPGNMLLVAAENAEKTPTGEYWHTETVLGEIYAVGESAKNHYRVDSRQRIVRWSSVDGTGRQTNVDEADRPLTSEDMRKWRAAGAPKMVEVPNYETGGPDPLLLSMTYDGAGPAMPLDDEYFGLSAKEIEALPTEAGALRDVLLGLEGDWHAYTSDDTGKEPIRALEGAERTRALSEVAGELLSTAPAPPKVRAAAFRLLAELPGVKAGGEATDRMGRRGTVVSLPLETTMPLGLYTAPKQLGTYTRQWIIDPEKGALLAIRDLVATPPKGSRPLPPGDLGQQRSLDAEDMPDRFHKPGELAGYRLFAVAEWTDERPK